MPIDPITSSVMRVCGPYWPRSCDGSPFFGWPSGPRKYPPGTEKSRPAWIAQRMYGMDVASYGDADITLAPAGTYGRQSPLVKNRGTDGRGATGTDRGRTRTT